MARTIQTSQGSWRVFWALAAGVIAAAGLTATLGGVDVEIVRRAVRLTAQMSLALFCTAFAANALARLWPSDLTGAIRRNRRQIGLAFAVSHACHAAALVTFARIAPATFHEQADPAMFVFGGLAYLFVIAMAATSFDRTAAWLGPRRWRLLHLVGGYDIWLTFLVAEGKRALHSPAYWPYVAVLFVVFGLRMIAMQGRPTPAQPVPAA
jgi:DMSO/TMAO reductase YedYZ heme-binding membrane subunit